MPRRLKASLKKVCPESVVAWWQTMRFQHEQAHARGRPLAEVFGEIYANNVWAQPANGARYSSGPGSEPAATAAYEDFVLGYLDAHPGISRIVDIGCGDFQVARRILARAPRALTYTGCDIAVNVVEHNRETYGGPNIHFVELDVTRHPVPRGEIVTIREVFQHLSNADILAAIDNLRRSGFKRAIVTECQPAGPCVPNRDIVSGYRTRDGLQSGVFLEQPPFGLTIIEDFDVAASPTEVLRTMTVAL